MGATFFGKRKDKFGVLVAKDTIASQVISYQFIRTEQLESYLLIVQELQLSGFSINSIIIDACFKPLQVSRTNASLSSAGHYDEIFNPKTKAPCGNLLKTDSFLFEQDIYPIYPHIIIILTLMFQTRQIHYDGGVFSPLKTLLRIHRGISHELKVKLIVDYLGNH